MNNTTTHLETIQIGVGYFVFRIPADRELDVNADRLPGVHKSKRAANKAAREIAAQTGETLQPTRSW